MLKYMNKTVSSIFYSFSFEIATNVQLRELEKSASYSEVNSRFFHVDFKSCLKRFDQSDTDSSLSQGNTAEADLRLSDEP